MICLANPRQYKGIEASSKPGFERFCGSDRETDPIQKKTPATSMLQGFSGVASKAVKGVLPWFTSLS